MLFIASPKTHYNEEIPILQHYLQINLEKFQKWIDKGFSGVVYLFQKWNNIQPKCQEQEANKVINQNKLEGAIRAAGTTQGKLANEMNISENTFSSKKKKGTFTIAQVEWLCSRLGIVKPEDKCEIFLPM